MASLSSRAKRQPPARSARRETASSLPPTATIAAIAFLVVSLVFGGTSRAGAGINLALEGLSLGVLLLTILLSRTFPPTSPSPGLTRILIFLIVVYALQLVPLPPQVWKTLSGRDLIVRGYELLNLALPWRPLSFSRDATVASALALLPGLCALSLVLRMPRERFHIVGYAIIAVSIISVLVGIAQLSGGQDSPLYLHNPRGGDSAYGFFSNPNHQSTLLLVTLPLLAAAARVSTDKSGHRAKPLWIAAGAAGLFLIFGILISESTGGLVLLVPTLIASGVLLLKSRTEGKLSKGRGAAMVVGILLALCLPIAVVMSGNHELSLGTSVGFGEFERLGISTTAIGAIVHYWPYGSGMGTFVLVYPAHENLLSVTNVFINHAHNEYAELLFESGILGAGLILSVLAWWTWRSFLAWRRSDKDAAWEQAASIAIAVIAVHSSFDYPARTPAILALGAAFCAILGRSHRSKERFFNGTRSIDGPAK